MEKVVDFSATKSKKKKRVISRCHIDEARGGEVKKKIERGLNILLPAPVKDTDGNIIIWGPHGGT